MMRWYEDIDGNFVEQFQTTGFDARIWELYLYAVLVEANLEVSHPKPAPDFLASGLNGEFALEATTINPTPRWRKSRLHRDRKHMRSERGISSLPANQVRKATDKKLAKEYWNHPSVTGKPLVYRDPRFP